MNILRTAFLEPGTERGSSTRIILCTTIMFANLWVTLLVITKGSLPELGGLAVFLGAVGTVTLGFNQAGKAVDTIVTAKTETKA